MAQGQGWSSLPADLVNRVADCLLATNDLDCYTDLRAVCHHWRSVTADPGSNQHDPRFRPTRWAMLDEHEVSSAVNTYGRPFAFVNTATGRFLRRTLPLDSDGDSDGDYLFVTSTTGGLVVLAARRPPHAVSVLNLFTGSSIRFAAPLPSESGPWLRFTADVVGSSSSPTLLVLVAVGCSSVYWAEPQSERFSHSDMRHRECPAGRLPQIAASVSSADAKDANDDMVDLLPSSDDDDGCRCYAVVAAGGDMLAVMKRRRGMDVFKVDSAGGNATERVKSIGSQALFLGVRCLVVDTADGFPTVEANCAYFELTVRGTNQRYVYKFRVGIDGEEEEPELVSAAADSLRPLTLTQLLCNHAMPIPRRLDIWKVFCKYPEADYYHNYIDYVDDE